MFSYYFLYVAGVLFETPAFSWNIPHSHFIVNKTESGLYQATNLEFVLDTISEDMQDAIQQLAGLTSYHVMTIMLARNGHDELKEAVDSPAMEDYWREYRKIEIELSRTKKDISHNLDRHFVEAIKETMTENIRNIIYQAAKQGT
jgi:hypothetical protein